MPQDRTVLVGTTDTDFAGDRDRVSADSADIRYLLDVLRLSLTETKLRAEDALSSYAGLRALLHDGQERPSSVPREETILESPSGLLSVAGGKLTTHRRIAQKVVDRVTRRLGRNSGRCPTLSSPLPGARPLDAGSFGPKELDPESVRWLDSRYGTRAAEVAELMSERKELAMPLAPQCPILGAEVVYAVRSEFAVSLADFLVRRSGLVWRYPEAATVAAPAAARLMALELRWSQATERNELEHFQADFRTRRAA